ncbi:alanine dehydrogenase [Alicyclobacillus cycloheptanicus]|uniref:Alanine dehydrogenase n=1 Tax=Alicyclobacillus cycloheptanicus TaxID=1457 RepID=A0ABT9XHH0_9BACL|nr:alanine dehydrogenase [Alicyclobacillus cycloheptanicus]MDQ0189181.1 alanine dehydrogenase [Alicyclobacillus cycloheptanicus]WDM00367.1 alanine dehydrogenase [Alicyclobacillus cycloheptanicus]
MRIGLPKEIKLREDRVGLTPGGVKALVDAGHVVVVEHGAGEGSGFTDEAYVAAGAVLGSQEEAWQAQMVVKVKEPLPEEYRYFREDLLLFTYLHLAADRPLTEAMLASGMTGIAYETVQLPDGSLPLLAPMSEVAGRMSVQVGVHFLEKPNGGPGILLGGVPGVPPAKVVVVGGGMVGTQAVRIAVGLGADVTVMDVNGARLRYLDEIFGGRVKTVMSNAYAIEQTVRDADLVVGAVLIPGARAPKLVTRDMVSHMKQGSVIVDVAVDQGGCVETADRVTTHDHPTYSVDGVIHYAVANMPGAVPRTSTFALTNATLPYILQIASGGLERVAQNPALLRGVNIVQGHVTHQGVADAFGLPWVQPDAALQHWVTA